MSVIDFIKENMNKEMILKVLEHYGAREIQNLGEEVRCCCPIHESNNNTSFSWKYDEQLWCCFVEGIGGDIFNFIAYMEELDIDRHFLDVVTKTAQVLELDITGLSLENPSNSYKKEIQEWLRYILKKQEVFNLEFDIKTLGDRYPVKEYRGIGGDLLRAYGVGYLKTYHRYIFPIEDVEGKIVGASLRAYGDEKPKWLHRPKSMKTGHLLYNLKHCIDKGYRSIYITEGMIDTLKLISLGIDNVVCTFGARVTDNQMLLLIKYFDEVILCFDNDFAGKEATIKAIDKLRKVINVKVMIVEGIKDVGEVETIEQFKELEVKKWNKYLEEI